ncbi:hypothetical protein D0Y65_053689 [Glycine soja]|nr:hypothetical protein D0Y65_053689 [Glycine soja]
MFDIDKQTKRTEEEGNAGIYATSAVWHKRNTQEIFEGPTLQNFFTQPRRKAKKIVLFMAHSMFPLLTSTSCFVGWVATVTFTFLEMLVAYMEFQIHSMLNVAPSMEAIVADKVSNVNDEVVT